MNITSFKVVHATIVVLFLFVPNLRETENVGTPPPLHLADYALASDTLH